MKIQDILDLGPEKALKILTKDTRDTDIEKWREEYDCEHEILKKLDKKVGETKIVKLAKLIAAFQKIIVESAVAFLFGNPPVITRTSDDGTQDAFNKLRLVMKKNKCSFLNRSLARNLFIDTQVAELWYAVKDEGKPAKIGVMLLKGDCIWAHFDETGDMDAFVRMYEEEISESIQKNVIHEIYTADKIIKMTKTSTGLSVEEKINPFGKIPVVYYQQDKPEWGDVQSLIDRFEEVISSHSDTNDYFASPMLTLKGSIASLPEKQQTGKVIRLVGEKGVDGKTEWGSAEYLTWDQSPESLELEINNVKGLIFSLTQTPDLSFDNVKSLGNISGIALKLMFFGPINKSKNKQEIFGPGLERRISVITSILEFVDVSLQDQLNNLEVNVMFSDCLPENITELVTTLSTARGGEPVMSRETAVKNNPLVSDADAELEILEKEDKTNSANSLAESFNP
jgi:SPP1 family phage portal protein